MNYRNIILTIAFCGSFSINGIAQLSDRTNNPSTIKSGTRPQTGNFGFGVLVSNTDAARWLNQDTTVVEESIMPLFVLKYYISDDLVFRFGVKTDREKTLRSGNVDPEVNGLGGYSARTQINSSSTFLLTPAIEKHFLESNIFDAYLVATLPIGIVHERVVDDKTYEYGDFIKHSMSKKSIAYGWGVHFGLQAFIADLPLAVGAEFGATGMGYRGDKYKNEAAYSVGGVETQQVYYTYKDDPSTIKYSDLKSNNFELGGDIRLSLSYYFR